MRKSGFGYLMLLAVLLVGPAFGSTTGVISGVVVDQETGAKLSGVNVAVVGTDLTTVTDANGFYVITNVPPGSHKVTAELIGYKAAAQENVQVTMDITSTVDFKLVQEVTEEAEAVVTVPRKLIKPDVAPTLYIVDSEQEQWVKNQPNNLYQISGLVRTQPGVTTDVDGIPHIRGGRNNQVGYMLEGIPVTEPATNGFGTSLVTVGLSKMQIYTGGYRAEYGNAISGVFNEIKKTGSELSGWRLEMMGGDQSFKGSYVESGGVVQNGLDYYVGTYLWQSDFERSVAENVESADVVGKFVYPLTEKDRLTLLLNQGTARYGLAGIHDITDNSKPVPPQQDAGHQGYRIAGLTWAHNLDAASFLTIRPYLFDSWNRVDALSPENDLYFHVWSKQHGLQVEYTDQLNEKHLLKLGGSIVSADNQYYGYIPDLNLYFDPTWGPYQYTSRVDTTQTGLYMQDQCKLNGKWMLEFGARYDGMKFNKLYNPDKRDSAWSPRLGITYSPDSKGVWRATWGKFIQFPPTYLMDRRYTDPNWENFRASDSDVKSERSWSFDFGYERQFSDVLVGRITPFLRKYKDLLQSRPLVEGEPFPTDYYNAGEGTSKGVECYLNKKFSKNWEGWISYTWMKAVANASSTTGITPGVTFPVDWDQRHTLQAVLNFKRNDWRYSLQIEYGSGLPYTGPNDTLDNQQRVPGHVIFSLNTSRKLPKNSWLGEEVYLNIYNLFNSGAETHRTIVYDDEYNPVGTEADRWVAPRFISLGVVRKF